MTQRRRTLGALLAGAATACGGTGRLSIRAFDTPAQALSGIEVVALPVNPEALLDSLAGSAPYPRPSFPDLEQQMASYRRGSRAPGPDQGAQDNWEAIRDSVAALADSLRALDRSSFAYRNAYGRLRAQYDRLSRRAADRDRSLQGLLREDRDLALRASRAADSLRQWEQVAYADFSNRLAVAVREARRDPRRTVTDSAGVAHFSLEAGRWWIQAKLRDPSNPFQEYVWNVPVTLSALAPAVLPLSRRTATRRWRH